MPEKWVLRQYQSLPLRAKVGMTYNRIIEWYDHFNGNVYCSFSGGKDSTVLAHLVHDYFPRVPLVFSNTGLEYPEIQAFARKMGAEFVRPKMSFSEVISKYGYPIISKENAEAIYYARRIRNGSGEYRHSLAKRDDLTGQRLCADGGILPECDPNTRERNCKDATCLMRSGKFSGGGVLQQQTANAGNSTAPELSGGGTTRTQAVEPGTPRGDRSLYKRRQFCWGGVRHRSMKQKAFSTRKSGFLSAGTRGSRSATCAVP